MERCPLCKGLTVTYDAYHKKVRCMAPFCEYDKPNISTKEDYPGRCRREDERN